MERPSNGARTLTALASGALGLPGLGGEASADSPVQETTARYAFSFYKEDNLSPGKFLNVGGTGSRDRYEIFAHQFNLLTPLTSRIDASVDLVFETMAGASPWWVEPNPDTSSSQRFLQVMSGATIFEERFDGQITLNHFFDSGKITASGGVSSENDYLSGNFAAGFDRTFNDKNTTWSLGLGFSWDTITPTDGATLHNRPLSEYYKRGFNLDTTIAQILSRSSLLQVGLAYKRSTGFLSDPYKRVYIDTNGQTVPDERPIERDQLTLSARYRHHVAAVHGSIHLDGAFHWDDWNVMGVSAEVAWHQTLLDWIRLVPSFRYYSQSQAWFYGPTLPAAPTPGTLYYRTSDYRLSPYGAISYGLRAEADLSGWPVRGSRWLLHVGYDRYTSRGSYALREVRNESPGLVGYHLFSVQLGGRF